MSLMSNQYLKEFKFYSGLAIDLVEYAGSGVMLGFFLDPKIAKQVALSIPAAEPAEDLHITLVYLGKREYLTNDDIRLASDVASKISRKYSVLFGKLGGVGRFSASEATGGKDVFYLSVNVPGLEKLQVDLVSELQALGVPI